MNVLIIIWFIAQTVLLFGGYLWAFIARKRSKNPKMAYLTIAVGCFMMAFYFLYFMPRIRKEANQLRNGDLIFVGLPQDYKADSTSMDAAISSATGTDGTLNLIHVAIAEVKADSIWIIDATIAHGVDRHPLDTFLTDFTLRDGSYPAFIVKRMKGVDADAAVERAKSYCGRAYDVRFLPDNLELYCSELVQLSYLDEEGEPIFESEPMNWLAPDGTMPPYWEWLFGKLGMEVPQGLPGTNPQRMSEDPRLISVELTDFGK